MRSEKACAKILVEQAKKYPYGHFEISEEQLAVLLKEQPELVFVDEGTVIVLETSDSEEKNLHWATESLDSLITVIQKLQRDLQAKMPGKWRITSFHPELVEPLCRIGFEVVSHYMDHWLYGLPKLSLGVPMQEKIRRAVASDSDRLAEISAECCYAPGWLKETEKWFADWLSDNNSDIFVVEAERNVAGYCCTKFYGFDSEKGTVVWVRALAVAPAYQRRGFGRALLLAGLEWGQRGGAQRSFIAVDKRNHIARELYESVEFRPSGAEEINLAILTKT